MKKVIVFAMLAILAIGSLALIPNLTMADDGSGPEPEPMPAPQHTWVMLHGIIQKWGSENVSGWLDANAGLINVSGTIHPYARVRAMWSPDHRLLIPDRLQNFSLSFYMARLVNTTQVAFNSSGWDVYVTGYWDVINFTKTIVIYDWGEQGLSITWTDTMIPLVTNASGSLGANFSSFGGIFGGHFGGDFLGGAFNLSIEGIDPLTGIAFTCFFRYFPISICDLGGKGRVDIHDLVTVAHAYGSMPGMSGYNEEYDFNFNGRVDMGDLATVAGNIGS